MADSNRLTPVQWTVCVIAAIGFAFDIYELLMLPLIVRAGTARAAAADRAARRSSPAGSDCCFTCRPCAAASSVCWAAI